jgi:hypothetical protein
MPTDLPDLTAARVSLIECGQYTADDCGNAGPCRRSAGHFGFCDPLKPASVYRAHLLTALAAERAMAGTLRALATKEPA